MLLIFWLIIIVLYLYFFLMLLIIFEVVMLFKVLVELFRIKIFGLCNRVLVIESFCFCLLERFLFFW